MFRKRRKQRRRSSGSSTDLVMESRRPSKRSCRIHRRGLGPAAAHPSGPTGSTPPTRFPSATDTSVLCSGPLPRSHRRDCGNVINSLNAPLPFLLEVLPARSRLHTPSLCPHDLLLTIAALLSLLIMLCSWVSPLVSGRHGNRVCTCPGLQCVGPRSAEHMPVSRCIL